ncbi:MAG: hypothetical protein HZB76_04570 [Chlamydiae bacterium]|nr:hypothetical protein [Chlamydiota bacterium]
MSEDTIKLTPFEEIAKKVKSWAILGPIFLIFSLFLASSFELLIAAILGLIIIARYKRKGFYGSLLIFSGLILQRQLFLQEGNLWALGIDVSVILSLAISYFSFDMVSSFLQEKNEKVAEPIVDDTKIKELQEKEIILEDKINELTLELQEKGKELDSYLENISILRKQAEENEQCQKNSLDEILHKDERIIQLETQLDALQDQLSLLKDEEFLKDKNEELLNLLNISKEKDLKAQSQIEQLAIELKEKNKAIAEKQNDTALIALEKELENAKQKITELSLNKNSSAEEDLKHKIDEKNELIRHYETKFSQLNNTHSLYKQLKAQFEEKNHVLHETRVELFHVKEELIAIKREQKESVSELSGGEKSLINDLSGSQEELELLEDENSHLKELILNLSDKLSKEKPKRQSKKKLVVEEPAIDLNNS